MKLKRKGLAGEANRFISRNKAIRKLQLNIHSFNRVCIIKGLFPIEPKNRIKAQKGDSKYRPLFLKKDIRFLMHDPLIWTIRSEMALYKKLRKARHKHDMTKQTTIKRNKPVYSLEQNVLERYPSFSDAVKDLADPLTMIFLFSSIRVRSPVEEHHVSRCQRLRTEFLTYVIEAQCLTKAFITTKGYYYEVLIMGHRIVWTVPHNCVTEVPRNADMKIMKHFLEFYIATLGFVMMRLATKVNLRYPLKPAYIPKLTGPARKDLDNFKDLMASLNYPLEKMKSDDDGKGEDQEPEDIDTHLIEGSTESTKMAYTESLENVERRKLFIGLKFFISRENNRESLTLIIRNGGGLVSWPPTMFPCNIYPEDDQTITHQIVDRPDPENKYLSRYYVQPQWVYDCLNAATLRPCQPYLAGAELPPHVCPFLKNFEGWYVPPEEVTLRRLLKASPQEKEAILAELTQEEQQKLHMMRAVESNKLDSDDDDNDEENDDNDDDDEEEGEESDNNATGDSGKQISGEVEEQVDTEEDDGESEEETKQKNKKKEVKKPEVRRGKEIIVQEKVETAKEQSNEYKMRAFMIHPKNKKLYNKLRDKEAKHENRSTLLKTRREAIELHKAGKINAEEMEEMKKITFKKTIADKKRRQYKKSISSAVAFSKSIHNKNRDKKKLK